MKKVDLSSGTRVCATCDTEKPLSEFYIQRHPGRNREAPRRDCKTCYNKEEYRREREDKRLAQYRVRGWAGEIRLALAGVWAPRRAFAGSNGVTRHEGKTA